MGPIRGKKRTRRVGDSKELAGMLKPLISLGGCNLRKGFVKVINACWLTHLQILASFERELDDAIGPGRVRQSFAARSALLLLRRRTSYAPSFVLCGIRMFGHKARALYRIDEAMCAN